LLPSIKAEVYFGHADNDTSMPADQILRFEKALKESKVRFKSEVYNGAIHGFTMADLPAYNASALDRHWKNLFDLFDRNL
jgi:carboxymethylenebutenolidase